VAASGLIATKLEVAALGWSQQPSRSTTLLHHTQSENGERFAERALSAAATCRMQRRSLFTYLSELLAAHNRGDPFPALT
jgi:hypothetical protein